MASAPGRGSDADPPDPNGRIDEAHVLSGIAPQRTCIRLRRGDLEPHPMIGSTARADGPAQQGGDDDAFEGAPGRRAAAIMADRAVRAATCAEPAKEVGLGAALASRASPAESGSAVAASPAHVCAPMHPTIAAARRRITGTPRLIRPPGTAAPRPQGASARRHARAPGMPAERVAPPRSAWRRAHAASTGGRRRGAAAASPGAGACPRHPSPSAKPGRRRHPSRRACGGQIHGRVRILRKGGRGGRAGTATKC